MLAYYIYPIPIGTEYTQNDLKNPDKVSELFAYCSILEGLITKEGWQTIISLYGYEKMYQLDNEADWHDFEKLEDYIDWVENEIQIVPQC